jgi:hypothetical protein
MLTLLTATGARPDAWAICEKLMAAQDYAGPVRWVIVDDGPEAQPITFNREGWDLVVIRPVPYWRPGQNTQARNLLAGLAAISSDEKVVCIEDDDVYASDWLSTVSHELGKAELVGEPRARYYNLALRRGRQLRNENHASLCSTAMRGNALVNFRKICTTSPKFIDIELWRAAKSKHLFDGHRVTGIKGMPGRGGIGMGHRNDFTGQADPDGELLRSWVGDAARFYL